MFSLNDAIDFFFEESYIYILLIFDIHLSDPTEMID